MYLMNDYDELLKAILELGIKKSNTRTGESTLMLPAQQMSFDLQWDNRVPIMTRRKWNPKAVFAELIWFLRGLTNNNDLKKLGCNYWTPWADPETGELGPVYGHQLRNFDGSYFGEEKELYKNVAQNRADQLKWLIDEIKRDKTSRRLMWSLWNPNQLDQMKLPPCHYSFQIVIDDNDQVYGHLVMRSADMPVGVPANIEMYSTIIRMLCHHLRLKPKQLIVTMTDCHIYSNQIEGVKKYLNSDIIDSPIMSIMVPTDRLLWDYKPDDFDLQSSTDGSNYKSGPKIDFPIAVGALNERG